MPTIAVRAAGPTSNGVSYQPGSESLTNCAVNVGMTFHQNRREAVPDGHRLRAVKGLWYPANTESLRLIRKAGGVSKLSPEDRACVEMKDVQPGEFCDDVPKESQAQLLADGAIERVPVATDGRRPRSMKAEA